MRIPDSIIFTEAQRKLQRLLNQSRNRSSKHSIMSRGGIVFHYTQPLTEVKKRRNRRQNKVARRARRINQLTERRK